MAGKQSKHAYPIDLTVDYPEKLSRIGTFFRWLLLIPVYLWSELFVLHIDLSRLVANHIKKIKHTLPGGPVHTVGVFTLHAQRAAVHGIPEGVYTTSAFVMLPVLLMILFRKKYPRWIFEFNKGIVSLMQRITAYLYFMTGRYPSSDEEQGVHVTVLYPKVGSLSRFLPFVKWFLAIPHYICFAVLLAGTIIATAVSWVAILFSGKYPRIFFDYNVGVMRWGLRILCYVALLVTDKYPPFSLKE